jgi:hypothetical protein
LRQSWFRSLVVLVACKVLLLGQSLLFSAQRFGIWVAHVGRLTCTRC